MEPSTQSFHGTFGPDLLVLLFGWLDPCSIKLFGATCLAHQDSAAAYRLSLGYGRRLARRALRHFAEAAQAAHRQCPHHAAKKERLAVQAWALLAQRARAPTRALGAGEVLGILGRAFARGWSWAPYALEWCAWRAGAELGREASEPRADLLALLQTDAAQRLEALAAARGWEVAASFAAALSGDVSDGSPPGQAGAPSLPLETIWAFAEAALGSARKNGEASCCLAMLATALARHQSEADPPGAAREIPAWEHLSCFSGTGSFAPKKRALWCAEDRAWLDLVGGDSARRCRDYETSFVCGPDCAFRPAAPPPPVAPFSGVRAV